jgi:2-keto-myo-inositol isomerase
MKLCFNEATTIGNSTLEQDLILCERLGYDLIEIRLDKLREYLQT